jgi:hypothetical protein
MNDAIALFLTFLFVLFLTPLGWIGMLVLALIVNLLS